MCVDLRWFAETNTWIAAAWDSCVTIHLFIKFTCTTCTANSSRVAHTLQYTHASQRKMNGSPTFGTAQCGKRAVWIVCNIRKQPCLRHCAYSLQSSVEREPSMWTVWNETKNSILLFFVLRPCRHISSHTTSKYIFINKYEVFHFDIHIWCDSHSSVYVIFTFFNAQYADYLLLLCVRVFAVKIFDKR